jgi:quercetin dioxygenase-like cupin family protein
VRFAVTPVEVCEASIYHRVSRRRYDFADIGLVERWAKPERPYRRRDSAQEERKMPIQKYSSAAPVRFQPGAERRVAHTENLMMVVIDFDDGPKEKVVPAHAHLHEQISCVAEGEIIVHMEGTATRLGPGDFFIAPSNVAHCIDTLSPHVRVIDCFTPIRNDFISA